MVAQQERTEIDETAGHLYRLDLARWLADLRSGDSMPERYVA